jgi:hypothetical protein
MTPPDPRRWYVVVDGTPVLPERPLPYDQAVHLFEEEIITTYDDQEVDIVIEIRQCTEEDTRWARAQT